MNEAERIALRQRREALGFTLRDVEAITEGRISNAYLSQLENGKITSPSLTVALELAAAYAAPLGQVAEWLSLKSKTPITPVCPTCGHAVTERTSHAE